MRLLEDKRKVEAAEYLSVRKGKGKQNENFENMILSFILGQTRFSQFAFLWDEEMCEVTRGTMSLCGGIHTSTPYSIF